MQSTESGSPITAIALSPDYLPLRPRPGAAGMPLPGMDVRVVDDKGNELPRGEMGNVVLAPVRNFRHLSPYLCLNLDVAIGPYCSVVTLDERK